MWLFHYIVLHRTKMKHEAPHRSSPSVCVNSSCSRMEQLHALLLVCWQTACYSGCGTRFSPDSLKVKPQAQQLTEENRDLLDMLLGRWGIWVTVDFKALKQVLEASPSRARDSAAWQGGAVFERRWKAWFWPSAPPRGARSAWGEDGGSGTN